MVKKYNRRKTVRLDDELCDYIEKARKKGFELSPWVREKLIERMERGPDQIRYEIEKCKAMKEKINAHFDDEIAILMEKLEAAEKSQWISDGMHNMSKIGKKRSKDVSGLYIYITSITRPILIIDNSNSNSNNDFHYRYYTYITLCNVIIVSLHSRIVLHIRLKKWGALPCLKK